MGDALSLATFTIHVDRVTAVAFQPDIDVDLVAVAAIHHVEDAALSGDDGDHASVLCHEADQGLAAAIISKELFQKVQDRMAQNKKQQGGRPAEKRIYPLKGKVFCGHCKSAMTVSTSRMEYDYYKCSGKKRLKTDCESTPISVEKLEKKVANMVCSILGTPSVTDSLIAVLRDAANRLQGGAIDRLKYLQTEETETIKKLSNAIDAVLAGMNSPALKQKIEELEAQKKSIRNQISTLRKQVEVSSIPEAKIRELLEVCQTAEDTEVLLSIVTRVEVTKDRVIVWTILDPDPSTIPDYDNDGIQLEVTTTDGTAFGVPRVFVTTQFVKMVVARENAR